MWIVDRIEGPFALCQGDDGAMIQLPLTQLPSGVREGDVLVSGREGVEIDAGETLRRRRRNAALFQSLLED